jgi:phage repressor protein C with HTH and peptisase S24 domain
MEVTDPRTALDRLVEASGESYAALSRMLRRNPAYLQQYVKRGTPRLLAERDRKLLAGYFRVDEAVLGGPETPAIPVVAQVRRLDVAASAGPGGLAEDDRLLGGELFDPRLLASLGVREDQSAVLRAQGDSMVPTIQDGDRMLIDERDRKLTAKGGVFVLRLDGALMVKRVAKAGDGIAVTSDNPEFPPIAVQAPDAVEVLGRVVWLSRALR